MPWRVIDAEGARWHVQPAAEMRADVGEGCNKTVPTRADLPKHDMAGGNYWVWPLIQYQDQQGKSCISLPG